MNTLKIKAIEISALTALLFCILVTAAFDNACSGIRENVLRLHVIANSDSPEDQSLKYEVRDAVLREGKDAFVGAENSAEAQEKIRRQLLLIRQTAQQTVESSGYAYDVRVELARSYFPTREYEGVTLPAGYYKAVRVIIGQGKGKNWWCVMFPPLCLPAAARDEVRLEDILGDRERNIVYSENKYKIRFWLVEKYYEVKENFVK